MLPLIMPAAQASGANFDISAAVYANKSLTLAAQYALLLSDDGMVLVGGSTGGLFFQFDFGAPWDISTATDASKSFNPASQDSQMRGGCFTNSGAKIMLVGRINDRVYQYDLSPSYDISTASYASKYFSVASQEDNPQGVVLSPDGTKAYVVGLQNSTVYQYTLGTPWDASTGTYATKSKSVAAQGTDIQDLYINPEGTKLFVLDGSSKTVYQYTIVTPFDISTASYDSISFSTATQTSNPVGLTFSADGNHMYVGDTTLGKTFQYDL